MVYLERPPKFNPIFEVSAIHLTYQGKLLMLQRHDRPGNREGGKWGVPAGKLNKDEIAIDAALRELFEETGIKLLPTDIEYRSTVFIKYPDIDYIYHLFVGGLTDFLPVTITKEHLDFKWIAISNILAGKITLPLIMDEDACLKLIYDT